MINDTHTSSALIPKLLHSRHCHGIVKPCKLTPLFVKSPAGRCYEFLCTEVLVMQMNCGHLCNGMCIGELLAATHAQSLAAVYAWAFLAAVICTAVLVATHLFLGTIFRHPYSHLSSQQQVVTCFHTAYAITYTVLVAPFTYYTCRLLFGELSSSFSVFTTTFIFFNINSMMYVAEAGARAVVQRYVSRIVTVLKLQFL